MINELINGGELASINYIFLFLVGLFGAVIANTTGAGGGIIFIPFFSILMFKPSVAVATSIGIQCLGMTAGSIGWLFKLHNRINLIKIALTCSIYGALGSFVAHNVRYYIDEYLGLLFGTLSLLVAYGSICFFRRKNNTKIDVTFNFYLFIASVIGGFFNYMVSIGIGELILFASVMSGFCIKRSIALAVLTTSFTVISMFYLYKLYIVASMAFVLPIGAGAIVGGSCASYIVEIVGAEKVKRFCTFIIGSTGLLEVVTWAYKI
ncbi:sulfite exporter TauE/SafE family protein [Vibrio parahaemolyticus]|nr:sulfite exporter TauE/SafE family protein [Vibrio parahaemolyticus]HCM1323113.1 sulfite exporter TauE/SafE family protein [Vibrio parahaemolyticus]HCM1328043.1 sulfite exporter TauE/SafE family protein [Vibrio parahaemolyticus]